jgi:hypothetical protein
LSGSPKKETQMSHITTPLLDIAFLYDSLTAAERNILHSSLLIRETKRREGIHKEIFPSLKTIAREAKCGTTTVKTFLNKMDRFKEHGFLKRRRVVGRRSNTYDLTEDAFEFLVLIQACRFQYDWKRYSKEVIHGLSEDEQFLAEKLYKKGELSTIELSTSKLAKLSTIKSFLLMNSGQTFKRTEKEGRTQDMNKKEFNAKSREEGIITDLPLSEKDRRWISQNYAFVDLRKARLDADCYRFKWGKKIDNMAAFFISRANEHAKERIWK